MRNKANAVDSTQKTKKKTKRALLICGALLCALSLFAAGWLGKYFSVSARDRSLLWMLHAVEENYREEVDADALYDKMYDAMELDRFCTHYTPEEYADRMRESEGSNTGFGISLLTEGQHVVIYRVVGGSPAELAGLKRGMTVHSFGDGTAATAGSDVVSYLEGTEEGVLVCGFAEDGSDARAFTVKRAAYLASYCTYEDSGKSFSFRGEQHALTKTGEGNPSLPEHVAYIRIDSFNGKAAREFADCLGKMRERGRSDLILDLRSNGGGYLSTLCRIAAYLLRNAEGSCPLVTRAVSRSGTVRDYTADGNLFRAYFSDASHVYVLADENTASASEALIGALIDYGTCGYGDVFLRKGEGAAHTYGKGVMQSPLIAPDGNVLQLTVADVFWPKGKSIHGVGVTEADGAVGLEAPLVWGEEDAMLEALLERLRG